MKKEINANGVSHFHLQTLRMVREENNSIIIEGDKCCLVGARGERNRDKDRGEKERKQMHRERVTSG